MDPLLKAGPAGEGGAAVGIEGHSELQQRSTSGFAGEAALKLAFTRFTSTDRLSKRFECRDGKIFKTSGVQFYSGSAETVTIEAPTPCAVLCELASVFDRLTTYEAIGLGVASNGRRTNTITTKQHDGTGGRIARCKARFQMPEGHNLILADGDGVTDVRKKLIALWPPFADVAMLARPSASAGITNPATGETLSGAGEHAYFIAQQAGCQKATLHAIRRLAWQQGQGRLRLSKAGSVLIDGLVDVSVYGAERLIYEGRPEVVAPLVRSRPPARVDGDDLFDADAFIAHVDRVIPEVEYRRLVAAAVAEPSFAAERDTKRRAFYADRVAKGVASGLSPERAERAARAVAAAIAAAEPDQMPRFSLTSDDVVEAQDGRTIRIADILATPADFAGRALADPFEGRAYGSTTAVVMLGRRGRPFIFSHAHGGCLYRLYPTLDAHITAETFMADRKAFLQTLPKRPARRWRRGARRRP